MRTAAFIASLAFVVAAGAALAQNAPPPPATGMQVLDFKPGFDDVMTMMVQPRHLKLFYAAQEKNWELAAFQLKELRSSFRRIGQTIPKYHEKSVDDAVAAILAPKMDKVDAAIKAGDAAQFAKSFEDLTAGCNACHQVMEHPFLVMKTPTATAAVMFPDQDFAQKK